MSINITKYTSTVNTTAKANRTIKYIVVHYTAGTSSKSGAAKNTAAFFMGGSAGGSADFIVDDENIVQYNPDIKNRYCWSVGENKYTAMTTSQGGTHYGICTNTNSVSVEVCSSKTDKSSLSATDTDWYFTDAVVNKAAEIVRYLMDLYNIGIDSVIMHHNVTGKICPNPWCVNENRLSKWNSFKSLLTGESEEDEEMVDTTKISVNGKDYTINRILKDDKNYISLADLAKMGFDVGYDAETKTPSLDNSVSKLDVEVNGEEKNIDAVNLSGYNYCKLRDVTEAIGDLDIDYKDGTVIINSENS
ncbi:MAG: N-acetylmuramoyl-L-alanine amidase [Clostridiales bacterium]|nr:N-acetylmuramoyl-L-alanine amidase [Clostridiales bacterium]